MPELGLGRLTTEQQNAASAELDTLSSEEIARVINAEDRQVGDAVGRALPQIGEAVEAIAAALYKGGRLIYVGAGTSGRIAAIDAAECPPTFNTDPKMVQFVIAGGVRALAAAAEYNEDSRRAGERDLAKKKPTHDDVVVGVAASGRTPYTVAALEYARSRGAKTVAVTCNAGSALERAAHIAIVAEVGPEVISGSTRMKAGTAQKMILNMLSTGAMTRLGYVYGNLMVNVHLTNKKLLERGITILQKAAGVDRQAAQAALKKAGNRVPVALVMLSAGVSRSEAGKRLKNVHGNVRRAMQMGNPEDNGKLRFRTYNGSL
ncbi:MAG: N-acetylmuramic acid 6-phosphate etherase [Acidobacteriales bacterium]|nr:N-acetylmuramic acid 6-phosphate etherase [Terriglobales bacterium]